MSRHEQADQLGSKYYIGTCEEMCPERERQQRFGTNRVSIFEKDPNTKETYEHAMVKEYRRAGADQEEPLPSDLRTPTALNKTVNYLLYNIVDDPRSMDPDCALYWYDFLWDRLRAVRKDIIQQNFCDPPSAELVEKCTRFHIHACYVMNNVKNFDTAMNRKNLNDCLQMLRQMYNDMRNTTGYISPNEVEFIKYDILLHLDEDYLSTNVLLMTTEYRSHSDIKFTTQILRAYTNNDYYRFFKLMKQADYFTSCILSLFVSKMRALALRIISSSCSSKQNSAYPAESLIDALAFDNLEHLRMFLQEFKLELTFRDFKPLINLQRDQIDRLTKKLKTSCPFRSNILVEDKLNQTASHMMGSQGSEYSTEKDQIQSISQQHQSKPTSQQHQIQPPSQQHESRPSPPQQYQSSPQQHEVQSPLHFRFKPLPQQHQHIPSRHPIQRSPQEDQIQGPPKQRQSQTPPHLFRFQAPQQQSHIQSPQQNKIPRTPQYQIQSSPRNHEVTLNQQQTPSSPQDHRIKSSPKQQHQSSPHQHQIQLLPQEHVIQPSPQQFQILPTTDKDQMESSQQHHIQPSKQLDRSEIAQFMPAGRFRNKTIKRPIFQELAHQETKIPRIVRKRSLAEHLRLDHINESIDDEKKANTRLVKLLESILFNSVNM